MDTRNFNWLHQLGEGKPLAWCRGSCFGVCVGNSAVRARLDPNLGNRICVWVGVSKYCNGSCNGFTGAWEFRHQIMRLEPFVALQPTIMLTCISDVFQAVFIGATLGSMLAFLLGRYLFRDCVQRMASKYNLFRAIDRALEGNGLKIMILLRLSPLIPYTALDYLSGLTSISFWVYSLALVAILPGTVMFCFLGATASSITSGGDNATVKTVSLVLGVAFALVGFLVASYYSKVELDKVSGMGTYSLRDGWKKWSLIRYIA
jgi:membrane protein DedA with SNARE-associated domain